MDEYAVKAEDTFGSTSSKPRTLSMVGTIPIGGTYSEDAWRGIIILPFSSQVYP
jgi:molybdopterin biosynthesis enzyme